MDQELKIKQLEIELKSMKELNSHLKIFLKKKISKTDVSAEKTADDLIDTATDLIAKHGDPKSSKANTSSSGSETSKGSKKRKASNGESKGRLKKRLVTIYGDSGLKG